MSPGGDLRLDWRAGNMIGKMLELLSSWFPQQDQTGPEPSWDSALSLLWALWGLCPLLDLDHMDMVCKECLIGADNILEKEEEFRPGFPKEFSAKLCE